MQTLEDLKKHFINELVHQDLRRVFYILRQNIDNQCDKYDDLNLLHSRYITASHDQNIKGTLSSEDARLIFNQLNAILLGFINDLTDKDLNLEPSAAPVSIPTQVKDIAQKATCNKGKILYKVPGIMELKKERKCIVRIAFDEKELEINDLKKEGSKIEPIRIAEVMEVQFIDQCKDDAFNIRSISSSEQLVDRGDFTEWIFYVEPLLQGVYDLLLKVSVIEKRLGREIRKDIVLEKKIEVVANHVDVNDNLGIYAQEGNNMAAAGVFMIPDGFEVLDQPLIWDLPMIPPLSCPPPPPPPPITSRFSRYTSVNEWLSIVGLTIATIALLWIVYIFLEDPTPPPPPPQPPLHGLIINDSLNSNKDELILTIDGSHPPFELTLKKEGDDIFSTPPIKAKKKESKIFSLTNLGLKRMDKVTFLANLKDKYNNSIDTSFIVEWKIPDSEVDTSFKITIETAEDNESLRLFSFFGSLPFHSIITDQNDRSKKWELPLIENKESIISLKALKSFPKKGTFELEVVDATHKMDQGIFSLYQPDSTNVDIEEDKNDLLTLKTSLDYKSKKLKIQVNGNRLPFKVFIDENKIATLRKQGSHFESFSSKDLKNKGKIIVNIEDKDGNTESKSVKIKWEKLHVINVTDCIPPEQLDKSCSVFYIYEEATPQNWNVKSNAFSDSRIIKKLNDNYTVYHLNRMEMEIDCGTEIYKNLEDANTFIFNGNNSAPIPMIGKVDPNEFYSYLTCKSDSNTGTNTNTGKGGSGIKPKKRKSLKVQLTPGLTYQIQDQQEGKGFSINTAEKAFRVRVISFSNEDNFNDFVIKLKKLNTPIFVRTEEVKVPVSGLTKVYLRVYLEGFKTKGEAEISLKKLKANSVLRKIFNNDEISNTMIVDEV
jgi:hypothetical protein